MADPPPLKKIWRPCMYDMIYFISRHRYKKNEEF
jgi:hypothetical protein